MPPYAEMLDLEVLSCSVGFRGLGFREYPPSTLLCLVLFRVEELFVYMSGNGTGSQPNCRLSKQQGSREKRLQVHLS